MYIMEKQLSDFLDTYVKYTDCYHIDFIDFLEKKGWYRKKSNCKISGGYIFRNNESWKHSAKFLKNLLDFSKMHWSFFLDIMKKQGYNFSTKSRDPIFLMDQIYNKGPFKHWWTTREDWIV